MNVINFVSLLFLTGTAFSANLDRFCYNDIRYEARAIQVEANAILRHIENEYQSQEMPPGPEVKNQVIRVQSLLTAIENINFRRKVTNDQGQVLAKLCKNEMNVYQSTLN